ncbi:MAG: DNA topoisomerase IB [Bacteroidota bacterium]
MKETLTAPVLSNQQLEKLISDPAATARAVSLVYVNSAEEGITRVKNGNGFKFKYRDKWITKKSELQRILSLVLPPAWKDVWICVLPHGHLQATGKDAMNRKQYRYHPLWNELRSKTKFFHLTEVGKALPRLREQLKKDLALPGLPRNKVLAAVISLMEKTGIRIGNEFYENLYGSFGLTTLKDKHVSIKGTAIRFTFRGKKGVEHQISLHSPKLAKIVKGCRDIPGKELFQYIDEEGKRQSIESGMVNEYLKDNAGGEFTAKDIRTWCGTVAALNTFRQTGPFTTKTEGKKKILEVLDTVALQLGNTRTVCKKYYVHPSLLELYENGKLNRWLRKGNGGIKKTVGLYEEEMQLMNILENI